MKTCRKTGRATGVNFVVAALVLGYSVVNAFGAWAVVRRKSWLAALFMLAAAILTVAAVALAYDLPESFWLVLVGVVMASALSFVNAMVMMGRVLWNAHALRAAAGLALVLATWWVLR